MTTEELIRKHGISLRYNYDVKTKEYELVKGEIVIRQYCEGELEEIEARKPEILAFLEEYRASTKPEDLINKYSITLQYEYNKKTQNYERVENAISVNGLKIAKSDDMIEAIKARKAEIIAVLEERSRAKEDKINKRKEAIKAIEGLAEIKHARAEEFAWGYNFDRAYFDESDYRDYKLANTGKRPQYDYESAYRKYPKAAAYLRAESLSEHHDSDFAEIGKKALDGILFGNWENAINTMEDEVEKIRLKNKCYAVRKDVEERLAASCDWLCRKHRELDKARQALENAVDCAVTLQGLCSDERATEKDHHQLKYAVEKLHDFLPYYQEKSGETFESEKLATLLKEEGFSD